MKNASRSALMMFASSEHDANLYYAVKCSVPDAFFYFRIGGRSVVMISDLEYDRVRKQARVDKVELYSEWLQKTKKTGLEKPSPADVVRCFLKRRGVQKVVVPENFPFGFAAALQKKGLAVESKPEPFWEERVIKARAEVDAMEKALRHTEAAVRCAEEVLRKAVIKGNRLYDRNAVVTSEALRRVIDVSLMENRCVAEHSIVAPGDQGCDPHCEGHGPIFPNQSIVLDIFPRSGESLYFADFTRTFVKGRASEALKRQYEAVKAGQDTGLRLIRAGAQGREVHQAVAREMEDRGFLTERRGGTMTGFFHGTGHGVGLEIHEAPRVNSSDHLLRAGEVVTVEPGLYYPGVGAVRLEDLVVVTKTGNRNLTQYPRKLEIK
jgi:Xaa-Pro aminopeptidase